MLHIYRHLTGLRTYAPRVITQKLDGQWPGVPVEVIPRSTWRFLSRGIERWSGRPWQVGGSETRSILRLIASSETRLLHVFFGNVAIHLLPLLRRCQVPVVISFHGSDVTGSMASPAFASVRQEMFQRAALVLCRSQQLADRVAELGCDPAKLRIMRTVIPGIDFEERPPAADGQWHLVQACRLVPKKGLGSTLRAFAEFLRSHPQAKLTIAGEGPMDSELRKLATELGIAARVDFTGFLPQPQLADLLKSAHIFLHPSETIAGDVEGIPNSLLEAMASGLPAIATRHGGIPEVITDHETGLLCNEADPAALARAMSKLVSDRPLAARLARQGSDFVREEFSADRQIKNIEALYNEASG